MLISVLIPSYNHERYVIEAIRSVINQTYQKIELILIDDGSQDKTWDKVTELKDECEERFFRVDFERQENHGTAYTLNRLFEKARGEYVFLLASDDLVKPNAIEILHQFLSENSDYGLAVGDNEFVNKNSVRIFWDQKQGILEEEKEAIYKTFGEFLQNARKDVYFNSDQFGSYESVIKGNYVPNGYLIRKSVINKIDKCNVNAPLEDWYLMLQISKSSKMKYINRILFSYRWHDLNSMKNEERILEYGRQTLKYEIMTILKSNDTNLLSILDRFIEFHGGKRKCFGLGNIINLYKLKSEFLPKEQYLLEIFNQRIFSI